jgi:hypothetical protein
MVVGYRGMKLLKSDRDNHSRERGSEAPMAADPKGQVRLRGTAQDQLVRVGEDLDIAVRSGNGRQDGIADSELSASEACVSYGDSPRGLRGVKPQHLFDSKRDLVVTLQQLKSSLWMRAEMINGAD